MKKPGWISRLEARWNVSTVRVFIILLVFACTGFSVLFLKQPILSYFGPPDERSIWLSVLYYILIFPLYNLILLFYGAIFGQFRFFWDFEKRFFKRIFGSKSTS
ncbi:DUF6787 family protein [Fulvivirga sedimenti]|uniref:Prolipoprotein diacylglyceryl transferase n=1 Tax=Fulvivirga sedimenti TaxID=2879465 RepID=A0A9X1HUH8_9BACT|nr:DUF6787 family protein [Fulvivirga sedimenti]MCA6078171.1 prolipoprotein diacylglyceryl transferase [Fulvivirga sedimenti]